MHPSGLNKFRIFITRGYENMSTNYIPLHVVLPIEFERVQILTSLQFLELWMSTILS